MLYILVFTRDFLSFWLLHEIWRCIGVARFGRTGQCEGLNKWNEWQDWLHAFMYIQMNDYKHSHTDARWLQFFSIMGIPNEKSTLEALAELGRETRVQHVTDFAEIAKYGVMQTPALVVDGKVVSYGKVLSKAEVIKLLKQWANSSLRPNAVYSFDSLQYGLQGIFTVISNIL